MSTVTENSKSEDRGLSHPWHFIKSSKHFSSWRLILPWRAYTTPLYLSYRSSGSLRKPKEILPSGIVLPVIRFPMKMRLAFQIKRIWGRKREREKCARNRNILNNDLVVSPENLIVSFLYPFICFIKFYYDQRCMDVYYESHRLWVYNSLRWAWDRTVSIDVGRLCVLIKRACISHHAQCCVVYFDGISWLHVSPSDDGDQRG
jgi:hypothetical protein